MALITTSERLWWSTRRRCRGNEFIALWNTEREKERAERAAMLALPVRLFTGDDARVALQRCPILRAGSHHFNTKSNANGQSF